jgi:hypothetical protein
VIFERPDGRLILRPAQSVDPGVPREEALRGLLPAGAELHIDADMSRAKESTGRLDLGYVVSVVLDAVSRVAQPSA